MNFLEKMSLSFLVDTLDYTSKELKQQIANGENEEEWNAIRMAKNQAFIAVLKKEIAKRIDSI